MRPWISLDPDAQAFPALWSHSTTDAGRRERPDNGRDVADGGTAKLPISTSEMGDPTRGMRPAGAGRSSPEFSPALGPRTRETAGSVDLSSVPGIIAPVDFAGLSVPVR